MLYDVLTYFFYFIAVLQIEPNIQKGNEGFVHHYVVYECDGNFTESDFYKGYDCLFTANMPFEACRQSNILSAWAIGGEVRIL